MESEDLTIRCWLLISQRCGVSHVRNIVGQRYRGERERESERMSESPVRVVGKLQPEDRCSSELLLL